MFAKFRNKEWMMCPTFEETRPPGRYDPPTAAISFCPCLPQGLPSSKSTPRVEIESTCSVCVCMFCVELFPGALSRIRTQLWKDVFENGNSQGSVFLFLIVWLTVIDSICCMFFFWLKYTSFLLFVFSRTVTIATPRPVIMLSLYTSCVWVHNLRRRNNDWKWTRCVIYLIDWSISCRWYTQAIEHPFDRFRFV